MFDTHESLAVRHTGQLIEQRMSDFVVELMELLSDIPDEDERRKTAWFSLLSVGSDEWRQADLDSCYLFVLTHYWQRRYIKPSAEMMFSCLYQLSPQEVDAELKSWCASDDRNIPYEEALQWSKSDECHEMVENYLEEQSQEMDTEQFYLDNADIFSSVTPSLPEDETISDLRYQELGSLRNKWRFIAEQIKYVDTLAPDITAPVKLHWLQLALVSQPLTEIFRLKKTYEEAILREQELRKTIPA